MIRLQGSPTIFAASAAALLLSTLVGCGEAPPDDDPPPSAGTSRTTSLASTIALANRDTDRALGLVLRMEMSPNELFEVYEPAPGQVILSGAGAPDKPAVLPGSLSGGSLGDVWTRVAGDRPMPASLRDVMDRMAQRRALGPSSLPGATIRQPAATGGGSPTADTAVAQPPASAARDGITTTTGALTGGWCDTVYYSEIYGACGTWDWPVCLNNWWNGAFATHPDINHLYSNVCPAQGNVTYQITSDEWSGGSWEVPQNTVRWFEGMDHGCDVWWWNSCPSARADVLNATGDRFQFRFLVDEP